MSMQCCIHVKDKFAKKSVLPTEKVWFLALTRNTISGDFPKGFRFTQDGLSGRGMTRYLLHYLPSGRLREIKNKAKFQTSSSKGGSGHLREVVAYKRFQI